MLRTAIVDLSCQSSRLALAAVVGAGFLCASPGLAQETPEAASDLANTDSYEESGEIIVTATRRSERLQDVPISVSALGEDQLERQGVDDLVDFATKIPALGLNNSGGPAFETLSVRGVGVTSGGQADAGSGPTVSVYIDETPVSPPFSRNSSAQPAVFDIDRIEVLRGPQGTLFGASSMGGTIRYITNKPDPTGFEAKVAAELSSTQGGGLNNSANAMVNIPLIDDKLAVRTVLSYRDEEGFIDRIPPGSVGTDVSSTPGAQRNINDFNVRGGRVSLRWTPVDGVALTPTFATQRSHQKSVGTADRALGQFTQSRYVDEPQSSDFDYYNLLAEYDFGAASVLSSTSFLERSVTQDAFYGSIMSRVTGIPLADVLANGGADLNSLRTNPQKLWVHETRLQSNSPGPLNWIVGGFYLHQKGGESQQQNSFSFVEYGKSIGVFDPTAPSFIYSETTFTTDEQFALFGDVTYDISDKLEASAGIRWTKSSRSTDSNTDGALFGPSSEARDEEFDPQWTPRFNVAWRPSQDKMIYATAAKGFRLGIDQTPITAGPCLDSITELGIDPESSGRVRGDSLWSYEVGAKTSWLDRRLTVNAAAYHIDWSDIQQTVNLSCGAGFITNAGTTSINGLELEVSSRPLRGLDLSFGLGFIDATVGSEGEFDIPDQDEGDQVPEIPRWSLTSSAQYSAPIRADLGAYVRADISWRDDVYQDYAQSALLTRPSYLLANASVGIEADAWDVALFVDNLFNEYVVLTYASNGLEVRPGRPRTFGIRGSKSF